MLDTARAYVKQGYSVIPVVAGEKKPSAEWKVYQMRPPTDQELVSWFGDGKLANIALVTGAVSGITAIDLDGPEGAAWAKANKPKLPDTRVHKTPHGYHLLYRYNPQLKTGTAFAPGVDVKSDGGCIVLPPSVVGGVAYTVARDFAPVELPDPAAVLVERPGKGNGGTARADAPMWVAQALKEGVGLHHRADMAAKLAGYFHSRNVAEDIILTTLIPYAEQCRPPFPLDELTRTVRSVCRYQTEIAHLKLTSAPLFREQGDTLLYTWEHEQVVIAVDNLRQDGDGLTGELTITATLPGFDQHVHGPKRFNLVSTTATNTLASYLNKRVPLDWPHLLEQVALLTTTRFRTGEPVINLATYTPPVQGKWCLFPLVLEGEANLLYGDGGCGKSTVALACQLAIQTGTDYLGLKPGVKHVGLYLDWESTAREHLERLTAMSIEADLPAFYYRHMVGQFGAQVPALRKLIAELGVGFVVIDSAGAACGGDPNEAKDALQVFDAARRLGTTTLIIHHTNKEGKFFGVVYWRNYARNMWEIRKQQDEGDSIIHIGLYHRKSNFSRLEKPFGLSINFDGDQIVFGREKVTDNPELAKGASLPTRIKDVLSHVVGGLTADELMAELELKEKDEKYLYVALNRGLRAETLTKIPGATPTKWANMERQKE